ncbi:MAG: tRNA lysidine(34) synthetase TilS [Hyphomicrobiales bacterium]|nr:tRNA lysidine(34) synthetase TilS [Hyphomicrobiales bacterium]
MPVADVSLPLSDGECEQLFAPLCKAEIIALAVSGGADSLALLELIDRWRRRPGRPRAIVLTVDHRLRPGSGEEARKVAKIAGSRGLSAKVLTVTGAVPTANVEAGARDARYGLLTTAARACGATHLLTAHHQDDQAETVLIRIQRGAGVFGLAAMRPAVECGDLTIFRPFLVLPRARLAATTAAAGFEPVDDPMNRDPRFLRARIRRLMPTLAAAGIGATELAATAERCAAAAAAIDTATDAVIQAAVVVDDLAIARIARADFCAAPKEVRLRLLSRLLMAAGGAHYPPRYRRLAALHEALTGASEGLRKRTLAGVTIDCRPAEILVYREAGRSGLAHHPIRPGVPLSWDRRFRVALDADAPSDLTVGPIGETGRTQIDLRPRGVPIAALMVQPGIWRRKQLLAAPSLGAAALACRSLSVTASQTVGSRLAVAPLFPNYGT